MRGLLSSIWTTKVSRLTCKRDLGDRRVLENQNKDEGPVLGETDARGNKEPVEIKELQHKTGARNAGHRAGNPCRRKCRVFQFGST
jgi:hypothetical protein